MFVEYFE